MVDIRAMRGIIGGFGGLFAGVWASDTFGMNFLFAWIFCGVILYTAADFLLGARAGSDRRQDQQALEEIKTLEEAGGNQAVETLIEIFKSSPDATARKAARRALDRIRSRGDVPNG